VAIGAGTPFLAENDCMWLHDYSCMGSNMYSKMQLLLCDAIFGCIGPGIIAISGAPILLRSGMAYR
jgi:hypothetical protein